MEKDFWILREGDLFPERVSRHVAGSYLKELESKGLVFATKEEAMKAGEIARKAIALSRSKCEEKPAEGRIVFSRGALNLTPHNREVILRIMIEE